jgi:hypothetical protein
VIARHFFGEQARHLYARGALFPEAIWINNRSVEPPFGAKGEKLEHKKAAGEEPAAASLAESSASNRHRFERCPVSDYQRCPI